MTDELNGQLKPVKMVKDLAKTYLNKFSQLIVKYVT